MIENLPYPWWGWFAMVFFFVGVIYIFAKGVMAFEDKGERRNSSRALHKDGLADHSKELS